LHGTLLGFSRCGYPEAAPPPEVQNAIYIFWLLFALTLLYAELWNSFCLTRQIDLSSFKTRAIVVSTTPMQVAVLSKVACKKILATFLAQWDLVEPWTFDPEVLFETQSAAESRER